MSTERDYQQTVARDARLRQAVLARVQAASTSFSPSTLQAIEKWATHQTDAILMPARDSKALFMTFLKEETEKQDTDTTPWWPLRSSASSPAAIAAHQRLCQKLKEKREARKRK
jgi:hypothetical protein